MRWMWYACWSRYRSDIYVNETKAHQSINNLLNEIAVITGKYQTEVGQYGPTPEAEVRTWKTERG